MTHFQIWGSLAVSVLICGTIYVCYLFVKHIFKNKGVPGMKYIHSSPIQRYHAPQPTIKTQYGRDLIHISTDVFSRNIDQGVDWAVNRAGAILNECNRKCCDIDIENVDKKIAENLAAQEALI